MTRGIDRLRSLFSDDAGHRKKRPGVAALPRRGVSQIVCSSWKACHRAFAPGCAQCRFRAFGDRWVKTYGTAVDSGHLDLRRKGDVNRTVIWLQERRREPGAKWALGCVVCANLRWRLSNHKKDDAAGPMRLGGLRCDTRWARLEVSQISRMCAWAFQQHAQTSVHKVAMHLHLRPQQPLESVIGDAGVAADLSLLQGAVPPPEHWLRAWRFVRTPTSFSGAQAILGTEAFLSHLRTGRDRQKTTDRAITKSIRCMADVIRARTRAALLAAHSVTIAVDDRGPYRLIRYRCDATSESVAGAAVVPPKAASHAVSEATSVPLMRPVTYRDGILGGALLDTHKREHD